MNQESAWKKIDNLEHNFDDSPFLFSLYDLKEARFKFVNSSLVSFSGKDPIDFYAMGSDPYKDLIHPEDYPTYLEILKKKSLDQCGIIKKELRLKCKQGKWHKFLFSSRLYTWEPYSAKPVMISYARQVPPKKEAFELNGPSLIQQLIQSLDEGFCIIEMIFDEKNEPMDYFFVETNPAFEEQIDLPDAKGKTMRELIPDHEEHWFQTYGRVALTGNPERFQFKSEKLNSVWLDVYAFRIGDKNSRKVAILFKNITEKKLAEEQLIKKKKELEFEAQERQKQLQKNTELLGAVFDTVNLGIAVFETLRNDQDEVVDFRYLRINKLLKEMYGGKEPIGSTVLQTSKYQTQLGIFNALKQVVATGNPLDKDIYFDEDGHQAWLRITARPQNGLLIATVEDISERTAEAQELLETVRFKRQLVRTTPETIMIINLNTFSVRYINKDLIPEVGMTRERIEGMPLQEVLPYVHPRDREQVIELHRKLLKASDDDIIDIEIRLKLGGIKWEWFSVRGKIFLRKDEQWVDEYVLLVRNITDQKNTRKALMRAEKFSIQGEIARTLAHELRNPLASIGMATELLENKIDISQKKELKNYFDILNRSANTLNRLVNNLLNSSNYTPSKLKKEDLARILQKTINQASDRIYLAGIKLVKNFEGPYPILADREKLQVALLNIIVNASEATTPDEGIIEVEVRKHKTDFLLNIRDNGIGLEEEQIERLFEAFYTNKSTGVGVGLSSVKTILEEHDAQIKVESKPNKGTCFKIYFHNADIE